MKRLLSFTTVVLLISTLLPSLSKGQVAVFLTPPPPNELSLSGVWSVQINNLYSENKQVKLVGLINETQSGKLYTVVFAPVTATSGLSSFSSANLVIEREEFTSVEKAQKLQSQRLLSFGTYVICMQAYEAGSNFMLSDQCQEHSVETFSPPALLSPSDRAVVETKNPLLVWLPPTPLISFDEVFYDLKLVEILPNQSSARAIQENYALLSQRGLSGTSMLHPVSAYPLEEQKRYAWQVTARGQSGNLIGVTEVWEFTIGTPVQSTEAKPDSLNGSYAELHQALNGSFVLAAPQLRFAYNSKEAAAGLKFRIRDMAGHDLTPDDLHLLSKSGANYYLIDLKDYGFKNGEYYILEVESAPAQRGLLMFRYFKSESARERALKKARN